MRLKDTGLTAAELKAQVKKYMIETYERMDFVADYAEGIYMYDENGEAYLDFYAGIAVNCLGNCNPKVVKAVQEQSALIMQTFNYPYTIPQAVLSKEICETIGMDKVMYQNSGAEANEAMIKIARKWGIENIGPDAWHIITAKQSFHGRTFGAMTATGQPESAIQKGFGDLTPGFTYAEFNNLDAFKAAYVEGKTCAIMFEPVQGEGGVLPLNQDYVNALQALCQKKDWLLAVDEVQTGVGRTGSLFCFQDYGILPDVVSFAKGIGGGLPLAGIMAGAKTETVLTPGTHATTFGGNPICCAGGLSVLEQLDDALLADVKKKGAYLKEKISAMPGVKEVRGMGLMLGVALTDQEGYGAKVNAMIEKGLLCLTAGHSTIRLLPPLTISQEEMDQGLAIMAEVLGA